MKHPIMRTVICLICAIVLLGSPMRVAASDVDQIYINSSDNPIKALFDSIFAINGDKGIGKIGFGDVYAITDEGITKIGSTTPTVSPEAEVTPSPKVSQTPNVTQSPTQESTPNPTVVPATPEPEFEDVPVLYSTVKVGLHYGSNAVSEANLKNVVGSGFAFGYFDNQRNFHEVAHTDVTDITLIPDWNWTMQDETVFGCFHILQRGSFTSFAIAQAEADRIGGFSAYYSGSYFINYGHYVSPADGEEANLQYGIDGEVVTQSSHCIVVTETGTDRILFEFDCGSSQALAIRPISEGDKAITEYNGLTYHGDFQFARLSGDQYMTAVNYVDIEDYTKGVIPYEMYTSWPEEALRAQALCARNYVATNFNRYRAQGFDVTADIYSQVYNGIGAATPETDAAVESTAGTYIRYEGKICQTFFFSSDGGATESSENIWGTKVPYLVGVLDPYEEDVETYSKDWTYICTPEELQRMVNERENTELDEIAEVDCSYTAMGNMKSITFIDINGKEHTVNGNRCTVVMGAKSQRFKLTATDDGDFLVEGSGWGHNCGMSQYGAYSMAKHHDKTAEEIIKFYYTGVYIR